MKKCYIILQENGQPVVYTDGRVKLFSTKQKAIEVALPTERVVGEGEYFTS